MANRQATMLKPAQLSRVEIDDAFWGPRLACNRTVTLPMQYSQLKPRSIAALKLKRYDPKRGVQPHRFWDSDLAKWIEAAGYHLATHRDAKLERQVDAVVELLAKAQEKDGYLNSYYSKVCPEKKYTDLNSGHELYCAGHLMEAAVAYYEGTGKRRMLDVMCRYADQIGRTFGRGKGQRRGYPGHPEIELALVKLYGATGEKRYLQLSKYFVDERGRRPNYFQIEAKRYGRPIPSAVSDDPSYDPLLAYKQAHVPIREQKEMKGHAVRGLYLLAGVVDVAARTNDRELMRAAERLWRSVTQRQMYITGGVGSAHAGERFTRDYDLPNERAYAETCAAIALVFAAHRFLQVRPRVEYADVMELALYNGILSGVSLSGDKYLYSNPLASHPSLHAGDRTQRVREGWFDCACCPPNLARLLGSLGQYAWSQSRDAVYAHLYIAGRARFELAGGEVVLRQTSKYPWDGRIRFAVEETAEGEWTLGLRVAGWCSSPSLRVNGKAVSLKSIVKDGYAQIRRNWHKGDRVELNLPMIAQRIYAHPSVREDAGRVALQRGPIVYCFEQVDNGEALNALMLPEDAALKTTFEPGTSGGVCTINAAGRRDTSSDWGSGALYRTRSPRGKATKLKAVPYYAWGNRRPGEEMMVWVRRG